jgi:hypothetical protein
VNTAMNTPHETVWSQLDGSARQVAEDLVALSRRKRHRGERDAQYVESSVRAIARRTGLTCSEVRESVSRLATSTLSVGFHGRRVVGLLTSEMPPRDHQAAAFVLSPILTEAL